MDGVEGVLQQMYDMLSKINVRGHEDIKRMDAVMDTLLQFISINKNKKEEEAHENRNEQRKDA